jgi:aryl-alcohol dehydrogenase-like predicted oxidoreductase
MKQRAFGRTGLNVPVIGMGTWKSLDVRGEKDEADRARVVEAAINAGTTLFDTSPMYGESERVLGRALAPHRSAVLIADKVWTSSPREGREQVRQALEWYGGVVDIYQIHNLVAWREHLPMLEELKEQGKVRVIGATHYAYSSFPELIKVMQTGCIGMIQIPYNAADRLVEHEILPLADELGLGVLVMEPFGSGALVRRPPPQRQLEQIGVASWSNALLQWILSDERVHSVLPATSKRERAIANARAGDAPPMTAELREQLAELSRSMR